MLKVEKVNKHFGGVQAICNCTLEVEKGTITGLIGPNGAGKTTLFNVITGFYKPGSGQIRFKDEDITGLQPAKTIAEQEHENLSKAEEILEFLEMKSKKDMPAKHLPGGEKKLLELGRMMMVDLDMILLDEPGAGIPPVLQNKVLDYIKKMSRERGLTLFVVEHDMNVIMNLCDPIIVMTDGSVLTQGSPEEVRSDKRVIQAYLGQDPSEHHAQ
jgi:ABC-type branched-subunit amino acid transport system ATPase component